MATSSLSAAMAGLPAVRRQHLFAELYVAVPFLFLSKKPKPPFFLSHGPLASERGSLSGAGPRGPSGTWVTPYVMHAGPSGVAEHGSSAPHPLPPEGIWRTSDRQKRRKNMDSRFVALVSEVSLLFILLRKCLHEISCSQCRPQASMPERCLCQLDARGS